MSDRNKKGVILLIVLGTIMVVFVLAAVIIKTVSSQSRLTHHQISRLRAYYASKAGMNLVFYKLRTGAWTQDNTVTKYYCINGKVDAAVACLETIADSKIPYNVQIAILPKSNPGINGTTRIDIKSDYTYTP